MRVVNTIKSFIYHLLNYNRNLDLLRYRYEISHLPSKKTLRKVAEIRDKERIKVAFIVYDVAKWKSERLFLAMREHPRFEPVIVPILYNQTDYIQVCQDFNKCINLLREKGYNFVVGSKSKDIDDLINPDIVFYGEHYNGLYDEGYTINYYTKRKSLGCNIQYAFKNLCINGTVNKPQTNRIWMNFYENESVINDMRPLMSNGAKNFIATGLPIVDDFEEAFHSPKDVWKPQIHRKTRLIWAPSYSIPNKDWNVYEQSTFLEISGDMLKLAEENRDTLQIAFKPHPLLRPRLNSSWGIERTNAYYAKWAEMENTQLADGQYVDLFMSSDAMIHDCMSFMVEYMYSEKPVLFLDKGANSMNLCNTQTHDSFAIHYKGKNIDDIKRFLIKVVIGGNDPLKEHRLEYKKKYIVPPYGKTACQNIINAILGEEEFADK